MSNRCAIVRTFSVADAKRAADEQFVANEKCAIDEQRVADEQLVDFEQKQVELATGKPF